MRGIERWQRGGAVGQRLARQTASGEAATGPTDCVGGGVFEDWSGAASLATIDEPAQQWLKRTPSRGLDSRG
jgi:hypothetical protein